MKQHALELFGFWLGLLGLTAKLQTAQQQPDTGHLSDGFDPIHGCDADRDRTIAAGSLVNIGVVALDTRPLQAGSHGRCPPGPVRVIASVG